MVAERSVGCRSQFEKIGGDIRSENADMSNDKHCEKQCRWKSKVFYHADNPGRVSRLLR